MAAIYMVGGPSGAGKDTLLLAARAELRKRDDGGGVAFVKRKITRAADKCTDLETPVTEAAMDAGQAKGEHAFYWEAHDTKYAIPKRDLDAALAAGKRAVLNVSRGVVADCVARYESSRCEVYFLNVSASASVLTQRLLKRGREPPEEVEKRVARAKLAEPQGAHVIHILNEGSKEAGCKLVTGALLGALKYSLWLTPAPDSISHKRASDIITAQSAALRDDQRGFPPHVTLCRSFTCSQRDAISAARAVATALSARGLVACEFNGEVGTSTSKWSRALVLELAGTSLFAANRLAIEALRARCLDVSRPGEALVAYRPHLSLAYGDCVQATLAQAKLEVERALATHSKGWCRDEAVPLTHLKLVMTSSDAFWCWQEVATVRLATTDPSAKHDKLAPGPDLWKRACLFGVALALAAKIVVGRIAR